MHSFRSLPLGPAVLVVLLTAGFLVSGCASRSPTITNADATLAAEPIVDASHGALDIRVTDEADNPIEAAQVGIRELGTVGLTDREGRYTFSLLIPNTYTLDVSRLGYEAWTQQAIVTAKQFTRSVISLQPKTIELPHSKVTVFNGTIVCGFGVGATQSQVASVGYSNLACSTALDPSGDRNAYRFTYPIDKNATGQLWEITWQPSQALSKNLWFILEKYDCAPEDCPPGNEDQYQFATRSGCCTLRIALNDTQMDKPGLKAGTLGGRVQSRTFPESAPSQDGAGANVFTEQTFKIYWEQFWGQLPNDFATTRTNIPT